MIEPKAVFVSSPSQLSWLKENYDFPFLFTTRFKEEEYYSYDDLLQLGDLLTIEESGIFDQIDINPEEDIHALLFTSGSTGHPKGVQITQHNLFQSAKKIGFRINCPVMIPCWFHCHVAILLVCWQGF